MNDGMIAFFSVIELTLWGLFMSFSIMDHAGWQQQIINWTILIYHQ